MIALVCCLHRFGYHPPGQTRDLGQAERYSIHYLIAILDGVAKRGFPMLDQNDSNNIHEFFVLLTYNRYRRP